MTMINFDELAGNGALILSGKEKGVATRGKFDLDKLDQENDSIDVVIPETLAYLTPSFVTGMFSASVKNLGGSDAFFKKYHFQASTNIIEQIRAGITSSLISGNVIAKAKLQ